MLIYYLCFSFSGPLSHTDELYSSEPSVSPGRRLVVPLHISVVQGLRFVKARLLSMEIPARVNETLPHSVSLNDTNSPQEITVCSRIDNLVKIDPYRGSWELRLLELELSNPTDIVFDLNVSVQLDIAMTDNNDDNITVVDHDTAEFGYPKTRIDRDCSARVLIPLEHFKLPILDNSLFAKDLTNDTSVSKSSSFTKRNAKAELAASISSLVSKIKVRWQSGRNSFGELNIKDAIQAALETSVMEILLPDPLTFGFRLTNRRSGTENVGDASNGHGGAAKVLSRSSISTHEMINIEVLIRNNTRELIRTNLSLTCRDVAGDNCIDGNNATVLWAGKLPPLCFTANCLINLLSSSNCFFF